jgi:hypothetical protein
MTEPRVVNKPPRSQPKPLRDLLGKVMADSFAKQGFASAELVTRWTDIVGEEIAAHSEPMKIQWPRPAPTRPGGASGSAPEQEPGTLVLRVERPAAIEVEHLSIVICDLVNRVLGWRAVGRIVLRQAPLRRGERKPQRAPDAEAAERIAATLGGVADDDLRAALARLGAAVKRD